MLINILFSEGNVLLRIISFVIAIGGIVLVISIHEAAHAFAAVRLGDNTPKVQGRLTLNPLAHLDPWGTLLIVFAGIGWGRPVEFNPYNLKNPRRDIALVALAGPVSNLLMAIFCSLLLSVAGEANEFTSFILYYLVSLNVLLAVFNLIPVHPLDGFKIASGILPSSLIYQWEETRKYGLIVLLLLLFTGVIERIVFPLSNSVTQFLLFLWPF